MRFRTAALLVVLSGLVSSFAFEPLALPYVMVLAVALLFAVVLRVPDLRWKGVMALGFLWGLAFFGPLIWWMRAVSDGAYVALVIAEAVLLGVVVLGLHAVARLTWWPVLMPAVWVLGEQVRGSFPFTGFPWGRLVHTALDTPLESWVRLVGMPATSFLMAGLAAALLVLVDLAARFRLVAAATIVGAILLGGLLPTGVAGSDGDARFALVQGDVPGEFLQWPRGAIFKLHAEETQRLVDRIEDGDTDAPDVVLWPENSTDSDPRENAEESARLDQLVADLGVPILVGGILDGPTDDTAENAGLVWTEDGPGEKYVKRKPVPYGEYVPFRDALGGLVPRIDRDIPRDLVAGDEPGALTVNGLRLGDTICYDIAYDGVVDQAIADDAQVLVVQTSNAAFTGTSQPSQQWSISRLRAIETGRWVLVPSTNGISGVIDADGEVVAQAPLRQPATIETDVPLAEGSTPAAHLAGPAGWAVMILGVVGWTLALVSRRREDARS
ncbi:apolipoprotein N-acyltransferase [Aeromicrobium sp. Leaf350]|uniref:apolipoprotein N-acyltransferase n=1 Tax=Aeromicrobium sp. Leaf350 TaxID=2876565 RepID=UPI001E3066EC|nr:apolipoprotein N-acyltransferase [Aeromicrobium sp. Leaf350]